MQNPRVTIPVIAAHLSLSPATISKLLLKLKQKGRIERAGSRKTGMWVIRE